MSEIADICDALGCSYDKEKALESIASLKSEITRLRATIDQLRAVAGAVSIESGLTFADIKKQTKIANNG